MGRVLNTCIQPSEGLCSTKHLRPPTTGQPEAPHSTLFLLTQGREPGAGGTIQLSLLAAALTPDSCPLGGELSVDVPQEARPGGDLRG